MENDRNLSEELTAENEGVENFAEPENTGELKIKEQPQPSEKSSISADLIRGHINTIILRTLDERDKYGYEIINEIEQKSHGQYELKQPTLYSALKRLETQGYIQAYWKSDEVSAGGRRKYFRLTESGREITEKNRAEWEYSRTVIDSLISDKSFDFSQPAPTPVDFKILKKTTSRVPIVKLESVDGKDEKLSEEGQAFWARHQALADQQELTLQQVLAEQQALSEQQELALQQVLAEQQALAEQQLLAEQKLNSLKEFEEQLNAQKQALEEQQQAFEAQKQDQQQTFEAQKAEQQQVLEEQKLATLKEFEEQLNAQKLEFETQKSEQLQAIALQQQAAAQQQQAIEAQRQQFILEQEQAKQRAIEEEQRKITHDNFLKLVNPQPQNAPQQQINAPVDGNVYYANDKAFQQIYTNKPETERDYRNLINNLFMNTVKAPQQTAYYSSAPEAYYEQPTTTPPFTSNQPAPTQVNQPYDARAKANSDGLKVNTTEVYVRPQEKGAYSKGKTLFKSSLIVAVIMLFEFALCLLFKDALAVDFVYPMVILAINVAQVGICAVVGFSGLIKNNRRPTSNNYLSTSIIICIVSILIVCLISLLMQVNFSSIADITAKIIIPCIVALNIPVFTVSFYLFSK